MSRRALFDRAAARHAVEFAATGLAPMTRWIGVRLATPWPVLRETCRKGEGVVSCG